MKFTLKQKKTKIPHRSSLSPRSLSLSSGRPSPNHPIVPRASILGSSLEIEAKRTDSKPFQRPRGVRFGSVYISELSGAMDADSWSARLSSASKRFQSALQSRSDMFMGFEEIDADDDVREEFPCPFCSEYFDIVGLCCHIDDEHPMEAKNGVCPVCSLRVGIDMVAHITLHHGNIFKVQRKRKTRKAGSHSTLSLLRRELREGTLQSLFGGSPCTVSSTSAAPDPLLSSFILPMTDDFTSPQPKVPSETISSKKNLEEKVLERKVQPSPLSLKDQEERTKRGEFLRGLLLSTILDDDL